MTLAPELAPEVFHVIDWSGVQRFFGLKIGNLNPANKMVLTSHTDPGSDDAITMADRQDC
ncbi:uncharacterized protein N7506_005792 [Penicillium brevicompactum]|uniref:uncharacterized protein n=1 Tax=Penicillium brevicompactum TaxID=5074 RepID=UPI0025422412|nr:uncharacterized protein N7506_005792 [Penicillium brevicompactum]KAJ5335856.1 hypothetical protein N7506_005792 [Penicillium brevicompactum]